MGGQYPGASFWPSSLLIVAPGTEGLTGPLGGKYLSVPPLVPGGMSARFPKYMVTGSVKVSRANTTAGQVTVEVTLFRNGSPAGISNVVVNAVNEWVDVPLVPDIRPEFDEVRIRSIDPAATIGIDALQFVSVCFGFTDVQPSDLYCNAVEWLGNRNVTFGCGTNQYCPDANVTRGQMALFMLRLGNALTPKVTQADCTRTSAFAPPQRDCVVAIESATYPRVASANLACGLSSANPVTKAVMSNVEVSTDGGTTWTAAGQATFGALAAGRYAGVSNAASANIAAGSTMHVAYEMAHVDGDGAASILAQCSLVVTVGNRLGTAPPY
jgi:hypothetical protein